MFNLLAQGLSKAGEITIIVLCILVTIFVLANIILVISLHRQNKKLEESRKNPPDEKPPIS